MEGNVGDSLYRGRRGREGKEKRIQRVVGRTSQNVVKKCGKEELGRIFHFFKVKLCDGFTEHIRSAMFKKKIFFATQK